MNDQHNENQNRPSRKLQVWYCEHCQSIHFKTQNVMLDFSKKEFVELGNAMMEIFQNNFQPLELSRFSNSVSFSDDILSSETIAWKKNDAFS